MVKLTSAALVGSLCCRTCIALQTGVSSLRTVVVGCRVRMFVVLARADSCGFLLAMNYRLVFSVRGISRTLVNRTVVLKLQCWTGRRAILVVRLGPQYSDRKLFVWVWAVWHLGRQWLVRCTT